MSTPNTVLITGANGMIGHAVVQRFLQEDCIVRAMVRDKSSCTLEESPNLEICEADLSSLEQVKEVTAGVNSIVHIAGRKNDEADSVDVNVGGVKNLIASCQPDQLNIFVNISTQSVKLKKKGLYATTKLTAEKLLQASQLPVVNLRPSVVYSNLSEGILASIINFGDLPFMPVIGNGEASYCPIHVEDLAELISRCTSAPQLIGRDLDIGGPSRVSFTSMIKQVQGYTHKKAMLLHIPIEIALVMAFCLKIISKPVITKSNVLGAAENIELGCRTAVDELDFLPRSFAVGLKHLFNENENEFDLTYQRTEARALLQYVSSGLSKKWEPSEELILSYLQALKSVPGLHQHVISNLLLDSTWRLGALDLFSRLVWPNSILQKKLRCAFAIYECSPVSASYLLPQEQGKAAILKECIAVALNSIKQLCLFPALIVARKFTRSNSGV